MDVLFVDDEVISFCFLVFLLTGPLLQDCWRSTPDPACLGITSWGCRTVGLLPVSSSVIFVPAGYLPDGLSSPL